MSTLVVTYDGYASPEACQSSCQTRSNCDFFVYAPSSGTCWLRYGTGAKVASRGFITGPKFCDGKFGSVKITALFAIGLVLNFFFKH